MVLNIAGFDIYCLVHLIEFPKLKELEVGKEVSICFERGAKTATSDDYIIEKDVNGNFQSNIYQTLSLVATLYRNPDQTFQVIIEYDK